MSDTYQAGIIISSDGKYAATTTARNSIAIYEKLSGKFRMVNELPVTTPMGAVISSTLESSKSLADSKTVTTEAVTADAKATLDNQDLIREEFVRLQEDSCRFAPQLKAQPLECIQTSSGQNKIAGINAGLSYQSSPKVSLQTDLPFQKLATRPTAAR